MIDCEGALQRLFDHLDGRLTNGDEAEIRRHLEVCRKCFSRFEFERRLLEKIRAAGGPQAAPVSLMEKTRRLLEEF